MEIGNKMIKLNWKFKIVSAILTGLLFVGIMCLMDYFIAGEFQSLNSYLFQGLFFGIFMGIGFPYVTQKFGTKFTSKIGKNIKPKLTQDETDILYENITEIIKRKTAKIIDNGIRIKTNGGNEFDFVVNEREKWIEKLNEKITHYNTV